MMFFNPAARHTRAEPIRAPRDRSVDVVLFLLLALVFTPVIGVHIALAIFDPHPTEAVTPANGNASLPPQAMPSARAQRG